MTRRPRNTQMFALPRPPPGRLELAGCEYRLIRVFKHDFWAATCLYERTAGVSPARSEGILPSPASSVDSAGGTPPGGEGGTPLPPPSKIVVKIGRVQPFCGIPLDWAGRWLRANEQAAYRLLEGVRGVPRWVAAFGATGYAVQYIDGRALDRSTPPPPGFFDRLRELFEQVHARGIAYTDSNKRSNILIGPGGQPYLVDYQISVRRRDDLPWPLRAILWAVVRYMQRKDIYHICKHKRRLAPQELTPPEEALSRDRGGLHAFHRWFTKRYRNVRRRFLRRQYEKGALASPTADLEDYDLPEKDSWRKQP
jgi:hypothetical protein